jgi:hypothetical protein
MTATRTDLHDYVASLRLSIPDIHPAGRATIDAWFDDMTDAADHDDTTSLQTARTRTDHAANSVIRELSAGASRCGATDSTPPNLRQTCSLTNQPGLIWIIRAPSSERM